MEGRVNCGVIINEQITNTSHSIHFSVVTKICTSNNESIYMEILQIVLWGQNGSYLKNIPNLRPLHLHHYDQNTALILNEPK